MDPDCHKISVVRILNGSDPHKNSTIKGEGEGMERGREEMRGKT